MSFWMIETTRFRKIVLEFPARAAYRLSQAAHVVAAGIFCIRAGFLVASVDCHPFIGEV